MILEMRDITKKFPGVLALDKVNFNLEEGEIHALVGENGAGKSTLIKILGGVHQPDEGEIILKGRKVRFFTPLDAQKAGISVIHQELNLAENLTVAHNIFLGREKGSWWNLKHREMMEEARKILKKLGFEIDPASLVKDLNVSEKQLVAIAKALAYEAKILVMDEPTATITEHEVERLFEIMRDLKKRGVSIIFISHRLDEIFSIADRVTVLRDGKMVGSGRVDDFTRDDLVKMMVGRDIKDMYPKYNTVEDKVIFEVKDFEIPDLVKKTSFNVRKGEIFGITGLVGCGKSELALGLFGVLRARFKEMILHGERIERIRDPIEALKHGIVMLPEDRKRMGLVLDLDIVKNISLPNTNLVARLFQISWKKAKNIAEDSVKKYRIKATSVKQLVRNLSGGNQQKVVVAKYLLKKPKLVVLVEPTRGIDVGAKVEVYHIINRLANEGTAVIFISSELPEVVSLCDRVLVMHRGQTMAILEGEKITQENILKAATGVESS